MRGISLPIRRFPLLKELASLKGLVAYKDWLLTRTVPFYKNCSSLKELASLKELVPFYKDWLLARTDFSYK